MVLETGLAGTHMIITGGTRGIGKSIVEAFLSEGANVSYCARTVSGDEFASFKPDSGARAVGTAVDVGDGAALTAWVAKSVAEFGRLDTVIGNASPMIFEGGADNWLSSFKIDIMGVVSLIDSAMPTLLKSPNPSVIVQSSFLGREYFRSPAAPYGPFKAAQLQHVHELSHQYGPQGVRVNAISPGPILFPGGSWESYARDAPEWYEQQRLKVPLRRLGSPQEIANAAVWLASSLSSYVAGTNLLVDGGIHVGTQF